MYRRRAPIRITLSMQNHFRYDVYKDANGNYVPAFEAYDHSLGLANKVQNHHYRYDFYQDVNDNYVPALEVLTKQKVNYEDFYYHTW